MMTLLLEANRAGPVLLIPAQPVTDVVHIAILGNLNKEFRPHVDGPVDAQVAFRAPGVRHVKNIPYTIVTHPMLAVSIDSVFTVHQEHGFRLLEADWA